MPTFGSLFSGIGGLDLGLERAGWECRWQVELNEWCRAVLARHWSGVPRFVAVESLRPNALGDGLEGIEPGGTETRTVERVDLVCGGFPCQPVSVAGKRLAQADERWLWPEFSRVVRLLRPRFVLVENVTGLLAGHGGMGDVLADLAESGYDAEWDCIPAAAVGAPHLRYRVFIVAHANGRGREGQRGAGVLDGERSSLGYDVDGRGGAVADVQNADGRWSGGAVYPRWGDQESGRRSLRRVGAEHWRVEPNVGRVADGVPLRVDRLRGLGNAVVPQVAEWIGRRLMEVV